MITRRRGIAIVAAWILASSTAVALTLRATMRDGPRGDTEACSTRDSSAQRGRAIYQRGAGGARIEGVVDRSGASMSGRDAACSNCHGPRGEGREEGAIAVPKLHPSRLFAPRERGYDEAKLARALREGVTPEGRALRMPMPRYALDDRAIADIAAYLGCLGRERDPGVTGEVVRVGAALPLGGPRAEIGRSVRDALTASFAEIHAGGGLRHQIEVIVEDTSEGGERAAIDRLISRGIFALVASVAPADEGMIDDEIPVIMPLAAPGDHAFPRGFYVSLPAEELGRVAVTHLARASGARMLVVHDPGESGARWLASARREASRRGLPAPSSFVIDGDRTTVSSIVEAAEAARADAILLAGASAGAGAALAAIEELKGVQLYASEAFADVPESLRERTWILRRGLGRAEISAEIANLAASLQKHGFAARHLGIQTHAAIAARVLTEGLRRAGSPPTRDTLVASLEGLRDFETGLAPPLTFTKNRHVGVMGAYVEHATGGAAWIEVTP